MWTSSERFYPNVNKFGTFLPKCGQDGSGYSKPLPLLFLVVDGNIAGDAPPPLILRLFLSLRLREFEREISALILRLFLSLRLREFEREIGALILRLFLSLRLREFEREIGGGSRAFLLSWAVHQNIYRYRVNDIQSRLNHPKTLSPARAHDPPPISLSNSCSRKLRNSRSIKGGGASPAMFPSTTGKRRGSGFEYPEPS
ncbi:hypothetical protein LXL04_014125 [Taraxacum kok-saghyz]